MEPVLKSNIIYLIAYAELLNLNKEYGKAIEKYTTSLTYHAAYNTFLELGRNYELSGDTSQALRHWELAGRMAPSRFEPLYLQIALFHSSGQYSSADSLTNVFLNKERKVDAIKIDRMMIDVREWEKERRCVDDK